MQMRRHLERRLEVWVWAMKAQYLDDFYRIEDCNESKDLLIAFLKSDVQVSGELLLGGERL